MLKDIALNELIFGNIKDFLFIKLLIAYNILASVSFLDSYLTTLFNM